ncbi:XK-related protein [Operophtera brumata]|uniref:XK-related protein n=1 Tax=Operophtera brumata TaxID=104452 RepID=A0A0L7L3Y0_OPEBR|nr:XK-related protein [Operophtera brumata]
MAEACRLGNHDIKIKASNNHNENFCVFNVLCVFISLISILADVTTDMIVFAEYCKNGYIYWALGSCIFILTPNILVNVFSLRWYATDQKSNIRHWITHGCLVGLLERYIQFLHKVFVCKNLEPIETQKIMSQRNDLCLLHFFASIASVVWGCSTYIYNITVFSNENFNWNSLLLKLLWQFCMLMSRIQGILLFTIVFDIWTLLPLGLQWSAMTVWIILQNTAFCPNKFEEAMYNIVMGFVYCFFYINLKEGHTRYRLLLFYALMVTQNFGRMGAMILYYRFFHTAGPLSWKISQNDIELNNKSIPHQNIRQNNSTLKQVRSFKNSQRPQNTNTNHNNSSEEQKQIDNETTDKKLLLDHWIARSGTPMFTSAPVGNISMDASSIEVYTVENTPQLKEDLKQSLSGKSKLNKKKICAPTELTLKLSCLENIESSIDEITSNNLNLYKRRGICSADELRDELNNLNLDVRNIINEDFMKLLRNDRSSVISHDTDGSNKKTSSDSIDMDLDLGFNDINSSDINTFNENIVQKLCLSALKNIKVGNQDADIENIQRIALDILREMYTKKDRSKNKSFLSKQRDTDTPTEILSVHDYENMCAVNIAREAWGLRSWKGYTDIENWIHDGSVVRDRRRDTLTSGSSEVSSCMSQDLKNAILTASSFPKKSHTYSNVFVKFDRTEQDDYANTAICQDDSFLAKPCVTDLSKDPNHLEPILEEFDDLGDIDQSIKKRLSSESSLVATIDEIRKSTANNSPRILYHRRDHIWDSPSFRPYDKIDNNLRNVLWKEPSKFDSSNIMKFLHEKENYDNELHKSKINKKEMKLNINDQSISNTVNYVESPLRNNYKNTKRRQKSSCSSANKAQAKRNNTKSDQNQQGNTDSDNDINALWHLVSSESDIDNSQTLGTCLRKEGPTSLSTVTTKLSNIKKGARNRPRRKFSILRERFEPRTNSDEEVLFKSAESILNLNPLDLNIINVKNKLCTDMHSIATSTKEMNVLQEQTYEGMSTSTKDTSKDVKEKRSLFIKQVLSPPKFNTKLKHKV